jgi:hypothetical protein
MKLEFTAHALERLKERNISKTEVKLALKNVLVSRPSGLENKADIIGQAGTRKIRVIYRNEKSQLVIITVMEVK